ncbi:cytochrome P450 [Kitasatospora sp. CB01950]|uniref:cytochrome P450 n=1 Tax=Kitasatospora sp. CB01950 TaxID=1703930 RepID=UPI0018E9A98B|nr:cytochrome P450 [Kitasatospora sp. CB01950]
MEDTPLWLITRHRGALQLLCDSRLSTDPRRVGHPFAAMAAHGRQRAGQFIDMDPPEHDYYRKILISEFGYRRARELRPVIERTAHEVLDEFAADGAADLVGQFGYPFSTRVICHLLGVPAEDSAYFHDCTREMIDSFYDSEKLPLARQKLFDYLDSLVGRSERNPSTDTLIGRLAARQRRTGRPDHDSLVGVVFLLLTAGHQTVANMLSLGTYSLLRHPEQLARVRADPGLWPTAIEELLRFHSIVDWVGFDRVATEEIAVGEHTIAAGEGVFVLGASANRDPEAFLDPDVLDIHRDARRHLAFGFGVHQCIGGNIARVELEVGYRALFDALPGLTVAAELDDSCFRYEARTFGMSRFPVRWQP